MAEYGVLRENLRQLERKLGLLDNSKLSCCGISLAQCHALVEIGRADTLSLGALADLLDLDKSTTSRSVDRLVRCGYVRRQTDDTNRRQVVIGLTSAGRQLFSQTETEMNRWFVNVMEQINPECREEVIDSLQILLKAIEDADLASGSAGCSCSSK